MDEKILIYIIIGIIYFLFNRLKKNNKQEEGDAERPTSPAGNGTPRPLTFEELLKEITEGKQTKPDEPVIELPKSEYKLPQPQPAYVDYDDEIQEEEKSLEKVSFDQERINQVYEDAKKLAFNRPSLEETVSLANVNTTFGKFKVFEASAERNLLHDYAKDLRDPKGFKKAFILSEVLSRKHF